jgi:hypothetical protein
MAEVVSRLALLMQVLGVVGNDVATALDIDPSLISKWKHNRRRVPERTDVMNRIAAYLLEVDDKRGGQAIRPMLQTLAGGKPIDRETTLELLVQWLVDPEPSTWFSHSDAISKVNLGTNSYTCAIEVFRGLQGRHSAVLKFLEVTRHLPPDNSMLLLIQENPAWLEASPAFQSQFKNGIISWLTSGHRVETINWIDRQPDLLQNLLHTWLPLELDFMIKTWYFPVYGRGSLPISILLVPGHAALVAHKCSDEEMDYHTILYSDQATVNQFEYIFSGIRRDCQRLVEVYQPEETGGLVSRFTENWMQVRNKRISLQSMLPMLISLPIDQLRSIFEENNVEASRRDDMLDQWTAYQQSRDGDIQARLIHHLGAIEHVANEKDYVDPFLSAMAGQPIRVRQVYFRNYLQMLSRDLQNNERIEVALVRSDIFNRFSCPNALIISGAFLAAWGNKMHQNKLLAQEATLVHAFERYFDDRWQLIPRVCRDRANVLALLKDLSGG